MRRSPLLPIGACLVLVAVLALGACSSSDAGPATGSGASGSGATVTIKHRYGTTTVPVDPTRIVSLDLQWTDVLLAMGHAPVGYLASPNLSGNFPWEGDRLADSTPLKASTALPYEQVAALHPDLIVVTYLAQNERDYDKLSKIAPTIPILSSNQVDSWQQITTVAGTVLGRPQKAQQVISSVRAEVAKLAAKLPGLKGKTFALANYVAGDGIYVVADPDDGANVVFRNLGLKLSPELLAAGADTAGRVHLSLERLDLLDTDLLVLFTNGLDPTKIPGYGDLPAVRSGAVAVLDFADVSGINTPTPLSVPYCLKLLEPALAKAAAG